MQSVDPRVKPAGDEIDAAGARPGGDHRYVATDTVAKRFGIPLVMRGLDPRIHASLQSEMPLFDLKSLRRDCG